jgi:hypothetical protein
MVADAKSVQIVIGDRPGGLNGVNKLQPGVYAVYLCGRRQSHCKNQNQRKRETFKHGTPKLKISKIFFPLEQQLI